MLKIRTKVIVGENNREVLQERDEAFPCICVLNDNQNLMSNDIPWHWHDLLEFNYILKGSVSIFVQDREYHMKKGDLLFMNSNVLHHMITSSGSQYYSVLLDPHFLSGSYNSAIEQKYFHPILRSTNLSSALFQPDSPRRIRMMEDMISVVEAMKEEPFGFELTVRERLSGLWMRLFEETREIWENSPLASNQDAERMKLMLQFIYDRYMDPITLEEIAEEAGISPRECTRCFQRSVGSAPIRFLIDYRVHLAAERLLLSSEPISKIAENCGFASDSYFGKTFRAVFGCTPREYRKRR